MTRLAALLVLVTATAAPALGADRPTATPEWIADRIAALNSVRFSERQAATRDLLEAGEPALDALRAAAESDDPEVRRRAGELARQIGWEVQNREILSDVPKLRLQFDGVPLSTAVAQFNEKTGLNVSIDPAKLADASRPVRVDTGELPFWEAVEQFYRTAGVAESVTYSGTQRHASPYTTVQGGQVVTSYRMETRPTGMKHVLVKREPDAEGLVWTEGPVRVRVAEKDGDLPDLLAGLPDVVGLNLEITPAPSLNVSEVLGVRLREVIDDQGRSLKQSQLGSADGSSLTGSPIFLQGGGQVIINGSFAVEPQAGGNLPHHQVGILTDGHRPKMLRRVEGHVALLVQTGPFDVLTIGDLSGNKANRTVSSEEVTLALRGVKEKGNGDYTVTLKVTRSQSNQNPFGNVILQQRVAVQGWAVNGNRVTTAGSQNPGDGLELRDADGKALDRTNTQITSQSMNAGPGGVEMVQDMTLTFRRKDGQGEPATLVMTGTKPFTVRAPFVLKNVPLP